MGEVRCAVERVDVPAILSASLLPSALLSDDIVPGERSSQALNNEALGSTVGFGDEVMLAL